LHWFLDRQVVSAAFFYFYMMPCPRRLVAQAPYTPFIKADSFPFPPPFPADSTAPRVSVKEAFPLLRRAYTSLRLERIEAFPRILFPSLLSCFFLMLESSVLSRESGVSFLSPSFRDQADSR